MYELKQYFSTHIWGCGKVECFFPEAFYGSFLLLKDFLLPLQDGLQYEGFLSFYSKMIKIFRKYSEFLQTTNKHQQAAIYSLHKIWEWFTILFHSSDFRLRGFSANYLISIWMICIFTDTANEFTIAEQSRTYYNISAFIESKLPVLKTWNRDWIRLNDTNRCKFTHYDVICYRH